MATEPTVSRIQDQPKAATTVSEWMAQTEAQQAQLVRVTGVKLNPTQQGLEIVLETENGQALQATQQAQGDTLILTVPNAVLALSSGQAFEADKPGEGIDRVTVMQADATTIRVSIVGLNDLPTAEIMPGQGLVLAVTPEEGIEEEITVTGEGARGYRVPNASTATRTDTPIRDIPQSIQVVPQEVLEDRQVRSLTEAVETVSGVVEDFRYLGSTSGTRIIRGFSAGDTFRNGFREGNVITTVPFPTIEQIEVLKGPASVVSGFAEPGGIINYVTKKPLSEPYYKLGFEAGNFGRYQPSIDLSGPLTVDKNVLYRFIASYERQDSYQEFANSAVTTIAPSISFKLGERTDLNLYYEYSRFFGDPIVRYAVRLSDDSLTPRRFHPNYPEVNEFESISHKAGYTLTHGLSDNWQIRNSFAATIASFKVRDIFRTGVIDDRFLTFAAFDGDLSDYNYFAQIDLLGKFQTGSIAHQLLIGFDFNSFREDYVNSINLNANIPPLDIRNPDYRALRTRPELFPEPTYVIDRKSYGVYLQDQIAFSDNLKLLIGGRYDWISDGTGTISPDNVVNIPVQNDGAFSPRVGLVYQPSKNVSLYASYTRSFNPAIGRNPDSRPFEPTRGTQYEVGVKTDFLDGRLSATLAAYNITKTNVLTPDPDPILAQRGFQVQVGEQRSRGIELDVAGQILPGWKITASYALTDATVSVDNSVISNVGNRLANVPLNQASLWTTYEIQKGDLQGLGFGFGLFYVGERQGDLANTFQVGDYLRTDAAVYYRQNGFNAAINIRNLFNIDYANSAAFGDKQSIDRGEPFTIIGSISWEL
ncbi:TonB-dependent siderophore receptor [Myxacorys almedinensis]|nr:TonB-dependent siderophore receptor [Myxacorys almedinensis]